MSTRTAAPAYTGRFAPSPTGPLHLGTLVAAMASYLDARQQQGSWLLRIEDVDRPREVAGAADALLQALESLGFAWDGPVVYQSRQTAVYQRALEKLQQQQLVYACDCSRKQIAEAQPKDSNRRYPGTCRSRQLPFAADKAIRVLTDNHQVEFDDRIVGSYCQQLERQTGDFVIRRRDGLFAYQLAVVIDDAEAGVTDVVRGSDLLDSTPRQIHLQRLLGFTTPRYAHTPLVLDEHGQKFSKSSNQGRALPLNLDSLVSAWLFLGQQHTRATDFATIDDFWRWAVPKWNIQHLAEQHEQ